MMSTTMLQPTPLTRKLQLTTVLCSVGMVIGTLLVGFVFENATVLTAAFQRTGLSLSEASRSAETFVVGYRAVALLFCVLYIAGAFYAMKRKAWAFWYIVVIFGVFGIAGTVFVPMRDTGLSTLGLVVSTLTDGSGGILGVILFSTYLKYHTPWAQRRHSMRVKENDVKKK